MGSLELFGGSVEFMGFERVDWGKWVRVCVFIHCGKVEIVGSVRRGSRGILGDLGVVLGGFGIIWGRSGNLGVTCEWD